LLFLIILTVVRFIPIYYTAIAIIYPVFLDKKTLKIDYGLVFTFLMFFLLTNLLSELFSHTFVPRPHHVFLFSGLLSQLIGNVPAALFFAKFSSQWKPLLWGTNVGGFGSLIASFANLIAYKFYVTKFRDNTSRFTIYFIGLGIVCFLSEICCFYLCSEPYDPVLLL
jgi:Na+/H+ antiporter NhaD/arsenite permease-like protein